MLTLFQSIFGGGEGQKSHPESLIEAAIERTVDGIDGRLRALGGYRKQLRKPVIHAIEHATALVDSIPAPLAAGRADYSSQPPLRALFASTDRMLEVFGKDPALNGFRINPKDARPVTALLLAERVEKRVFGVELAGEKLRRDVAQTVVNFRGHRLVDPAASEEDTRRLLKRRAFDHVLSLALAHVVDVQAEHAELKRQHGLLKRKLSTLQQGGWGFDDLQEVHPDAASLQAELDEIEEQIAAIHTDSDALRAHLAVTTDLLMNAERQLWAEVIDLHMDRMNIKRNPQDASAQHVVFQELHNARGRRLVMVLVSLTLDDLPRPDDFFAAAERYLR